MMNISIVTVAYNSGKTISKAIESVLNQTYQAYEYIIVDGSSNDNTVEVAKSYIEIFEKAEIKYRIISEPDKGLYDAMNKGIGMATGDMVGMINSDDWYESIALQTVAETYQREPFELFYATVNIIKPTGNFLKKSRFDFFPSTRHWNHPTTFIARSIYNNFKYNIDNIYCDWDLILKLRKNKCKTAISEKVLANFVFGGRSNKKSIICAWKRFQIRYNVYRRNGYSVICFFECFAMETIKYLLG